MERFGICLTKQLSIHTCLVLAWETIIEALLETDFLERNGNLEDGAAAAHLVSLGHLLSLRITDKRVVFIWPFLQGHRR